MGAELSSEDQEFLDNFDELLAQTDEGEATVVEDEVHPAGDVTESVTSGEKPDVINETNNLDPFGDTGTEESDEPEQNDYDPVAAQELYSQLMANPLRANGKDIQFQSVDEVVKAAQMGLNYTKKMQEMAKYKRTIATLNENGVKSDSDLQYLLDLHNKNPEAIAKFFKDNGIDPYDIDTSTEVDYKPSTQMVADDKIRAHEALAELKQLPGGIQTLSTIVDHWDDASLTALYASPDGFRMLHEQRESGIFDDIMNEIDRLTTLGQLPAGRSTLELYNMIGDRLISGNTKKVQPKPQTSAVASSQSSTRSNKRAAASSPRGSKRTKGMAYDDLLDLDNEAFLKAMNSRL